MKKIIVLISLVAFVFTGCRHDEPKDDLRLVTINLLTESLSSSVLKSQANDAENKIQKIKFFGVDEKSVIVESWVEQYASPIVQRTISKNVMSFYAIANPSTDLEAATPSSVTDLMNLTGNFTTAPVSPFLMGGIGDVIGDKVNIELIRVVAKIEVIGKNDFQIETVAVSNTPKKGYVFKQGTLSVPTSDRVNYSSVTSLTPTLYVAESIAHNPARFDITGQYEGKQAKYTITLKSEGQEIDIVRNTHYQVSVMPITDKVCEITVGIPEWVTKITDDHTIPDSAFDN